MNTRQKYVNAVIERTIGVPSLERANAFAPSNIALCKYWGKRCSELNLPVTDSLSISLGHYGANTTMSIIDDNRDNVKLNGDFIEHGTSFYKQISSFLDLFRGKHNLYFLVETYLNIPACAGLASSACGFAALTLALNQVLGLNLSHQKLSLLARLGSGSACRSLWHGFVHWRQGSLENGLDSFAYLLPYRFLDLRVGLLIVDPTPKAFSSRDAMVETVKYSRLYRSWPVCAEQDLKKLFHALENGQLAELFAVAERNSLAMHATMLDLPRPIVYSNNKTWAAINQIWNLRDQGISVYFTQDAGPNLKLLFDSREEEILRRHFPEMYVIRPFDLDRGALQSLGNCSPASVSPCRRDF